LEQIMQRTTQLSRDRRILWIAVCFVLAAVLSLPSIAMADIVSGRVLDANEKPILNGSFTAKDAKGGMTGFKSNKDGNYSVFLEPGKYTVTYTGDATLTGAIESFPQPRQSDVHLKKIEGK
jgi:hypothetical protein